MGTTYTSGFQNDDGMAYTLVVAIEGVGTLYHTGESVNDAAVDAAWTATEWTLNRPGLQVKFDAEQTIEPWKADLDVNGLSFGIMDTDDSDTMGTLAFGSHAGVSTFLNGAIDCNDATITVLSTSQFASSGTVYIGTEAITYTGKTGTSFTGCTRGMYAPFKAHSETQQRFGRAHALPIVGDGVITKPKVSSLPRVWKGRWIGVWLHRRSGTTLDTKAEAQCIFAGKIVGKRDEANGMTWFECEDAKAAIRGATLFYDQFTAKCRDGIYLRNGDRFEAGDNKNDTVLNANDLVVVASGASGVNEINAGRYTIDELTEYLNQWWAAEKVAGRLSFDWVYTPRVTTAQGLRGQLSMSDGHATVHNFASFSAPLPVMQFLGWNEAITPSWPGASHEFITPNCPYRILMSNEPGASGTNLELDDIRGTFWDNSGYLPSQISTSAAGSNIAVFQVNDGPLIRVIQLDADTYQIAGTNEFLEDIAGIPWDSTNISQWRAVRLDEGGEIRIKQVAIIRRSFRQFLTRALVSTGTANYNHTVTYDVWPAQLSAAMPWELFGDPWLESVTAIDDLVSTMMVIIDKPTRLIDIIGCELAVRFASIIWKNGGFQITTWGTPTSATAEHAFTENNKATPTGTQDNLRTVTNETDQFLVNVVKLKYGRRGLSDEYAKSITITDKSSISDHGEREPIEIEMRNTFAGLSTTTEHIDELAEGIANMMSIFSRPMHMLKRTIDLGHYEGVAPGDYCSVTDDHARDPSNGTRGLSAKPGLIVGHRYGLGGYEIDTGSNGSPHGEVDVLLMPFDNIAAYCPAADIASYVAGTKVATCTAHAYSESSEAADATHFPVGSVVRWLEIDPDDPTAPATDLDVVAAQSGNDITLTTGITGYSASLKYRIISDEYANATTAQQANVYQADDADGLIAAGIEPYEYGMDITGAGTYSQVTGLEQVALYSQAQYGKGVPLDVGGERDIARLCNSLQNWRTQPVMSSMSRSVKSNPNACVSTILEIIPVYVGPGQLIGGERYLQVRPWYRSATGGSVTITATLCRTPPAGTSLIITDATDPVYILGQPNTSVSWTTTSTTWAAGAADVLSISVLNSRGIGFLVIEGTEDAETRGMCQMHVRTYVP